MQKSFRWVAAIFMLAVLAGCENPNLGVMTYDQAVVAYGPPDKERYAGTQRVAVWNTGETVRRDRFGIEPRYEKTYNQVVRVFDAKGVLVSESYR